MRISDIMTQGVVTAETGDTLRRVGELMRGSNVGSVVICESGRPVGVITDRDLALAVVADNVDPDTQAGAHASRPIVTPPLAPGQTRKEFEGVFVARGGRAVFVPVKTGIAGERYFEVLEGLTEADDVIVGPFASVRTLREGDQVRVTAAGPAGAMPTSPPPGGR